MSVVSTKRFVAAAALLWATALLTAAYSCPIAGPKTGINPHTGKKDPDSGVELLGTPAPSWTFDRWLRTKPMSLDRLRGKVVLMRWWTEGCHYCESTLPVLERLRKEHPNDLVVIGVFHPKPPHEVSNKHILAVADELGFGGPIAFDRDWKTLDRYWLDAEPDRNWTSVSFLIDRDGVIRWVQGGGEYYPTDDPRHARCNTEYHDLERALEAALAAKPTTVGMRSAE
jgi:thiol-disulfide isomerase/thioredoxin